MIIDGLKKYKDKKTVRLHIPGHKGRRGLEEKTAEVFGKDLLEIDVTEVHHMDDLHQPSGMIRDAQEKAANLWKSEKTYFLVNGSSSGLIAAINSAVKEGEKILIPRNVHKSVYSALALSGGIPVYFQPEMNMEQGVVGGMDLEKLEDVLLAHPDLKAMVVINPTYQGVCSDLKAICQLAHSKNVVVIADEAHGAHLAFSKNAPLTALEAGADLVIQSTHKTLGSLTQSSMLHVQGNLVDYGRLKYFLEVMQSTSPSYLLMASLDSARSFAETEGEKLFNRLEQAVIRAKNQINRLKGFTCLDSKVIGKNGIYGLDPFKLVISGKYIGLSGYALHQKLYETYHIECEYGDANNITCLLGIGSEPSDIETLVRSLEEISESSTVKTLEHSKKEKMIPPLPNWVPYKMTPREAMNQKTRTVSWEDSVGEISGEMIIPYPPGIPVVLPGEIITEEIGDFLANTKMLGGHIQGPLDKNLKTIKCINRKG